MSLEISWISQKTSCTRNPTQATLHLCIQEHVYPQPLGPPLAFSCTLPSRADLWPCHGSLAPSGVPRTHTGKLLIPLLLVDCYNGMKVFFLQRSLRVSVWRVLLRFPSSLHMPFFATVDDRLRRHLGSSCASEWSLTSLLCKARANPGGMSCVMSSLSSLWSLAVRLYTTPRFPTTLGPRTSDTPGFTLYVLYKFSTSHFLRLISLRDLTLCKDLNSHYRCFPVPVEIFQPCFQTLTSELIPTHTSTQTTSSFNLLVHFWHLNLSLLFPLST